MNNSNSNNTSPFSLTILDFLTLLQNYIFSFNSPLMVTIGIIGNIVICLGMMQNEIKIKSNLKVYYIAIAIGDIGSLLFWHLRDFLTVGLWFLSNGKFYLYLYSTFLCKLWLSVYDQSFILSMYTVIAYGIERNLALYFPFKHKSLNKTKMTCLLLIICVGIPSIIQIPVMILTADKIQIKAGQLPFCGVDSNSNFYAIGIIGVICIVMIFHPLITAILVFGIVIKINQINYHKKELSQQTNTLSKSEMRAVLTLLTVASINLLIFIPNAIFYSGVYLLRAISPFSFERNLWETLARISFALGSISHALNFFVYCIQIPSFRKFILCHSVHPSRSGL